VWYTAEHTAFILWANFVNVLLSEVGFVDGTGSRLSECLRQYAQGDRTVLRKTLALLADHIIFAPVSLFVDLADDAGTKKAKVVTLVEEGRRLIPAFTSEDLFFDWAQNDYQCLPMRTADFALTLPPNTGLLLNPGLPIECEFSSADLEPLLGEDLELYDELLEEEETLHAEDPFEETLAEPFQVAQEGEAENHLMAFLKGYPEVLEAYFVETRNDQSEMVLGLLTQDLSVERRFVMIAEVGEISRRLYGYAGAIETYTDLHVPHSSSWELFRLVSPFFVREAPFDAPFEQFSAAAAVAANGEAEGAAERLDDSIDQPGFSLWRMFKSKRG
jgi:hypothetical protein